MSPFKIIASLIKFSICAGLAGGLVDLTRSMGKRAAEAQHHGLVSLTDLNRQLFSR